MNPATSTRLAAFAALAVAMAATRFHHFLPVPDASWTIFFVGGFYLAGASRWAFPLLMLEAVLIDYLATQHLGVSDYCITPAYWFLVPTHAVLWFGGLSLRGRVRQDLRSLALLVGCAFVSITLAYAISNGSFYWLGGRVSQPSWSLYIENFQRWYPHFLSVPAIYLAMVAAVHVLVLRRWGRTRSTTD